MEVSVVIPVYNAEQFVGQAIESALALAEVREVILVEDNSPDQALKVCQEYASRHPRVSVLRHPNGENRGVSASRNLGIRHAKYPFVAFLDADDQYTPHRFATALRIFEKYPDADGVYGHIGTFYHDLVNKELHLKRQPGEITGLKKHVPPEELLSILFDGRYGNIHLDSLVLRKQILSGRFLFDESLKMAEDTDFIQRLAANYRLYAPEEMEIVALRGVHRNNTVFNFARASYYRKRRLEKCIRQQYYGCTDIEAVSGVIRQYVRDTWIFRRSYLPEKLKYVGGYMIFALQHPEAVMHLWRLYRQKSTLI